MNMRLRELARVKERQAIDHAKNLAVFLEQTIEELKPEPSRARMSNISELAAKITAARKAREARVEAIASKSENLGKRAEAALSAHEADLAATEVEVQELEASLNPMVGHNGAPE